MTEPKKIFGTDGVRGIANIEPMTVETALKLGRAAAHVFKKDKSRHRIVIGKDTRLSCYMVENALVAGICSMGVDTLLVGPLPTPGVSFITRSLRADAGIVISASHNAYQDNGIKFFGADGYKLSKKIEEEMESLISSGELDSIRPTKTDVGKAYRIDDALGRYVEYAKQSVPKGMTFDGMRIIIDCANGAAYKAAPCILRELGAEVIVYNDKPDGTNINKKCGSIHPEEIRKAVIEHHADVGIAVDGDADRVIMADESAREVDGDIILAIIAEDWKRQGKLPNDSVVTTLVGNLGIEKYLKSKGIKVIRCDVGDRNVIYSMKENGAELGGESCGHIIVHEINTTGDGMMAALQVLAVMRQRGVSLGRLIKNIQKYPSVSENIFVKEKIPLEKCVKIQETKKKIEEKLGDKGRIIIRYSGTENKLRLLIEGDEHSKIAKALKEISKVAKEELC
ncbi:MAG: phosphoglucosamine mutase [Chlamydiae bacterium]|nr:MAG: phosphoglucosamine mutase [Chlamydiota bacterium]